MARKPVSMGKNISGKLKRAMGELTGRPDLVLEGESEDTGCIREDEKSGRTSKKAKAEKRREAD